VWSSSSFVSKISNPHITSETNIDINSDIAVTRRRVLPLFWRSVDRYTHKHGRMKTPSSIKESDVIGLHQHFRRRTHVIAAATPDLNWTLRLFSFQVQRPEATARISYTCRCKQHDIGGPQEGPTTKSNRQNAVTSHLLAMEMRNVASCTTDSEFTEDRLWNECLKVDMARTKVSQHNAKCT
jgi:hypothetical protein